jgi:hypothetical protein
VKFYLRMEAVNIQQFIADCEDLSTVRGGGLLLLDSPHRLKKKFPLLSPLSVGGSSGLFEFDASTAEEAGKIRNEAESFFNSDPQLCHATFIVDITPASGNFLADRETVLAKNRWRQMQSPTVAVPQITAKLPCRTDKVRPGDKWENDEPMSTSVKARRAYGKEQKQAFYSQQTGLECPRFVNNFDELTSDSSRGNLHHKMAVIHLDGNGFGKLQNELCDSPQKQRAFDQDLRKLRRGLLEQLLKESFGGDEWTTADGEHRIETLLWGGDEIVWVVPAWVGLPVLDFFFKHSAKWRFPENEAGSRPLTHAGAVVFCHHNAPVHRITALAKSLTELAKDLVDHGPENVALYQILESFDDIGRDLEDFAHERLPEMCPASSLLLRGGAIGSMIEDCKTLKQDVPRNKVHDIAHALMLQETAEGKRLAEVALRHGPQGAQEKFHALAAKLGGEHMAWVHLAELWDYIPE